MNMTEDEIKTKMTNTFSSLFECKPEFFCMAAGRVNVIGEHIDYNGFAVLPIAINRRSYMLCSKVMDKVLHIQNMSSVYAPAKIELSDDIKINGHDWYNYVLCGIKGILEHFGKKFEFGLNILVYGDVPIAGGLSSSSALVVCSSLVAFAYLVKIPGVELTDDDRKTLATVTTSSEKYIGTQGGGMDQTVSLLGRRNTAILIEFQPITIHNVQLLSNYVFVLADSMATCKKAETAVTNFNLRVLECRVGCLLMLHYMKITEKLTNLKQILNKLLMMDDGSHSEDYVKVTEELKKMMDIADKYIHKEPYNFKEIAEILQITPQQLIINSKTKLKLCDVPPNLRVSYRLKHVLSEATRVYQFYITSCSKMTEDEKAQTYGYLMNESHISCKYCYDCSHEKLEELRNICINAKALGCRLTGAGWGGYTISLVKQTDVQYFKESVTKEFYNGIQKITGNCDKYISIVQAADGADIFQL